MKKRRGPSEDENPRPEKLFTQKVFDYISRVILKYFKKTYKFIIYILKNLTLFKILYKCFPYIKNFILKIDKIFFHVLIKSINFIKYIPQLIHDKIFEFFWFILKIFQILIFVKIFKYVIKKFIIY
uniref:Uncharacterized 15.7 kDa protein in rpl14-rpl12 intergenic region n=1 Tax=Euglena longa TaxID=3037 RepID=YCX8_EUGLO|nr:hypothetical protein AsloCp31 [Euglena longa]P58146.1 RecName: Full=Uncharacterized 15.7 kDa protein in rpl14-rpl12 intergenic region; AltName: Full=ORF125b [Euglena longa]CAC24602.1 hypothetical protein [Euglena longa]